MWIMHTELPSICHPSLRHKLRGYNRSACMGGDREFGFH